MLLRERGAGLGLVDWAGYKFDLLDWLSSDDGFIDVFVEMLCVDDA